MTSKEIGEDIAFFLYLLPIVFGIVYGAYEWYSIARTSSTMPTLAYLIVSKNPYLFLVSIVSICVGVVIEAKTADAASRQFVVNANSTRMEILAIIILIISFAGALSASSYDGGLAFSVFLSGRYPIIYAFFLLAFAIFLSPRQLLTNVKLSSLGEIIGLLFLAISPVVFYGGVKVHLPFVASSLGALLVAAIGLYLLMSQSSRRHKTEAKSSQVQSVIEQDEA